MYVLRIHVNCHIKVWMCALHISAYIEKSLRANEHGTDVHRFQGKGKTPNFFLLPNIVEDRGSRPGVCLGHTHGHDICTFQVAV